MRQAKGSAILDFANALREGNVDARRYVGEDFKVLPTFAQNKIVDLATGNGAQILCGSNKNCGRFNRLVRTAFGCSSNLPQQEDRMMILKNRMQPLPTGRLDSEGQEIMRGGMVNGEIFYADQDVEVLTEDNVGPIIDLYTRMEDQYRRIAQAQTNEHTRTLFNRRAERMVSQINTLNDVVAEYKGTAGMCFAHIQGCDEMVPIVVNLWSYLGERERRKLSGDTTSGEEAYFWNIVRKVTFTSQFAYACTTHKFQGS